jgi:small subunit ribosomal protein S17
VADETENVNEIEETPTEPEAVEEPAAEAPEEAIPEAEASDAPEAEVDEPVTAEATEEPAPEADAEEPAAEIASEAPAEEAPAAEERAEEPAAEASAEEPPAEAEAPAEAPAAEAAEEAPVAQSQPKRKKKRLPRSLRPQKTRRRHVPATERKAITRLPKPEHERGRRQERQGRVVSAAADKTIVVRVDVAKAHPMYKKVIRRSSKFHAHDEENQAKVGDIVRIVETRPLSKLKRWRLTEVVEAAK